MGEVGQSVEAIAPPAYLLHESFNTPLYAFCCIRFILFLQHARCPTTPKLEALNALCGVCDLSDAKQ